ncbi:MAG: thioredoxin domain-containing protein [Acidobacteriota bacterium]|nr:thioredoxin domain-containing protein [Acidobacteriota bacterium]
MSLPRTNALAHAASAYLRSAMHQPTQWHQWGPEAFALAAAGNKPVLLDIGAVWCHWCHVMDRESYESEEIAAILNEHFVAVKVDRDERPDVDARYQVAVAAINGQGGWPLTVFLTPEGKPFYGGTYFPPVDGYGRPSFKRILMAIAEAFRERRGEVEQESEGLMHALEHAEGMAGHHGEFSPRVIAQMVQSALGSFDREQGGFSAMPKFPHAPVVDLLLDWYARTGEEQVRHVAAFTLEKMARGGVYDQLAGGFHRYSVDERWCVPHFEKMAYDNSELLKNYVHAFQVTGEKFFAETAHGILRWLRQVLSDREKGGYYGSQDADINLHDDGDYFTWTLDEARAVLTAEELAVAAAHYDIGEQGEMHHNPEKNVLWMSRTVGQIAAEQKRAESEVSARLASARQKMLAARLQRPTPFVDRTLYTNWNALCIAAVLRAARVLGEEDEEAFALRSLDRLLAEAWSADGLRHVIAYAEDSGAARPAGVLDDYAYTILACLEAYESTGELRYFTHAQQIAARMIDGFHDAEGGGFFDLDTCESPAALGALAMRRKPFQDAPTPAGNSAAALALLRLHALNGEERLRELAVGTLEVFAGVVEKFGIYAATYGLAALWLAQPHVQVIVFGQDALADELYTAAVAPFLLTKTVLRVRDAARIEEALPATLAATVRELPGVKQGRSLALLCSNFACQPPLHSVAELGSALREAARQGN